VANLLNHFKALVSVHLILLQFPISKSLFFHASDIRRLIHLLLFHSIAANSRRIKGFWICPDFVIDVMAK
jgi:hypothetical protein